MTAFDGTVGNAFIETPGKARQVSGGRAVDAPPPHPFISLLVLFTGSPMSRYTGQWNHRLKDNQFTFNPDGSNELEITWQEDERLGDADQYPRELRDGNGVLVTTFTSSQQESEWYVGRYSNLRRDYLAAAPLDTVLEILVIQHDLVSEFYRGPRQYDFRPTETHPDPPCQTGHRLYFAGTSFPPTVYAGPYNNRFEDFGEGGLNTGTGGQQDISVISGNRFQTNFHWSDCGFVFFPTDPDFGNPPEPMARDNWAPLYSESEWINPQTGSPYTAPSLYDLILSNVPSGFRDRIRELHFFIGLGRNTFEGALAYTNVWTRIRDENIDWFGVNPSRSSFEDAFGSDMFGPGRLPGAPLATFNINGKLVEMTNREN